jgi:hypothetical protein
MARLCVITGSPESSKTGGRRGIVAWEEHRHGEEKEEEQNTYMRLVAEAMAWRGSARAAIAAARPRVGAGVTPTSTNTTTAARHGDDGTGTASSTAPGRSQGARTSTARTRVHRRPPNRPRRFSSGSRSEAIRQERTKREKLHGQIDRSARGGSGSVGGYGGGARRWPEQGGGHGGDAIATGVARRLGLDERVRGPSEESEVGRFGATEPKRGPALLGRPWVKLLGWAQ